MTHEQLIEELKKLGTLHDSGILTDEEFKEMKQVLLKRSETDSQRETSESGEFSDSESLEKKNTTAYESKSNKIKEIGSLTQSKTSKNHRKKRLKISKCSLGIICGVGVLLSIFILFLIFHKSDYQKALDSIDQQQGRILSDVEDNDGTVLIYATDKGLYLWNLKNKEPQKLYSNLDSLTIRRFWSDFETFKIQESEEPASEYNEDGRVANIFSQSPQKLYRVIWPWILIGKHYVANVNSPNKLFNISYSRTSPEFNGLLNMDAEEDGGDWVPDSVGFNDDGDFVINVYNNNHGLPGIDSYSPQFIEAEAWRDNNYVDTDLLSKYGNLFPEYNRRYEIGIPIGRPYVTGRTIWIDKNNTIHRSQIVSWGKYTFNEKDMTPDGMAPVYQKVEQEFKDNLTYKLSKKREELEEYKENFFAKVKEEAIPLYDLTNLYKTNLLKAKQSYPLNQTYILEVRIDEIETTWRFWLYEFYNYSNASLFFTNDESFDELSYPCTVYLKAYFYLFDPTDTGSRTFVFEDANLIFVE